MATVFTHGFVSAALAWAAGRRVASPRLVAVLIVAAVIPDLDVLGLPLGISLDHPLGHRGFTHSVLFAAGVGVLAATAVFREHEPFSAPWARVTLLVFLAAASHGILDALTNGGRGVAFFLPFSDARYHFPWRPIQVSPLGIMTFFRPRAWPILASELLWVWLPILGMLAVARLVRSGRAGAAAAIAPEVAARPLPVDAD